MTAKENMISKYGIQFDESYFSPEHRTVTYYFTADKNLINMCFPGKYPEATSTEISVELPVSCRDVRHASVMVSPTLDCDGCETDYDWLYLGFSYAEIEEFLALAKEPVVIVQLDYKASYNRYALTLQEFYEEFENRLEEDMPGPSEQSTSYTLRPMIHVWYELVEIGNPHWEKFFTDMEDGLPESDIKGGNLAHIDFENLKSLKDVVIDTALRHQEVKILSCEECPDPAYGKYIVQYQVGTDFISFMFSRASKVDKCIESVKEEIAENLLQNAPLPLWSVLSKELLDEIVESSFDMHFIEKDSENWTQATADAILYEAETFGLSDVVTAGEDCYITIYAAAMCSVNWFGHATYGKPYSGVCCGMYVNSDAAGESRLSMETCIEKPFQWYDWNFLSEKVKYVTERDEELDELFAQLVGRHIQGKEAISALNDKSMEWLYNVLSDDSRVFKVLEGFELGLSAEQVSMYAYRQYSLTQMDFMMRAFLSGVPVHAMEIMLRGSTNGEELHSKVQMYRNNPDFLDDLNAQIEKIPAEAVKTKKQMYTLKI